MSNYMYVKLWDVVDHAPSQLREEAMNMASSWPGFPENPTDSNAVELKMEKYFQTISGTPVRPAKPYSSTSAPRVGYARLSNYNTVP